MMGIVKTVSLATARSKFTFIVREVESGSQVLVTKDRHPAVRIISESEYQQMERRLAVAQMRALGEKWRARGITWRALHKENRKDLESRP